MTVAEGIALRQDRDRRIAERDAKKARGRVGQYLWSSDDMPSAQPPMPGEASTPGGVRPMPQTEPPPLPPINMQAQQLPHMPPGGAPIPHMPPGGAPPMPQMGAPPMPGGGPPQQMPMPGAMPIPQPPAPPPMAMPPSQPQGPPAGPGGPGGAAPPDPFTDALHTLRSIAQAIKAKNPGITPDELMDATSQTLDTLKGLAPETVAYSKALLAANTASDRNASNERIQSGHDDTRISTAQIRADAMRDVETGRVDASKYNADQRYRQFVDAAEVNASSRRDVAGITADSRRDVATTGAGARVDAANIGADSRRDVAGTNADASDYRANMGYAGQNDRARGQAGVAVKAPTKPFAGRRPTTRSSLAPAGPPVPGARKAPDGKWYVPDPARQGKYLLVQ